MINAKEAKRMFVSIMKGSPRVKDRDSIMKHCEYISVLVKDTVKSIKAVIPEFIIDEEEMEIACLLHDIGYCFAEKAILHPVVGGEFLKEKNLETISTIIRGHTYAADALRVTGYKGLIPEDYEPKIWQHILLDYASLHCGNPGEEISPDEKFKRFRAKRGEEFQKVIDLAEPRLRQEVEDVESLLGGNLEIMSKYIL
ncbi:HD domain-containing protein [Elusimicrobiota bacterium]